MCPGFNHQMNTYTQVGVETAAPTADPHKLILMLFDGAIEDVYSAKGYILQQNSSAKGEAISRALSIIGELNASLNFEAGGEVALNLDSLYRYMTGALLSASSKNQPDTLAHIGQLLSELRGAWAAIAPAQATIQANRGAAAPSPERVSVSYGKA